MHVFVCDVLLLHIYIWIVSNATIILLLHLTTFDILKLNIILINVLLAIVYHRLPSFTIVYHHSPSFTIIRHRLPSFTTVHRLHTLLYIYPFASSPSGEKLWGTRELERKKEEGEKWMEELQELISRGIFLSDRVSSTTYDKRRFCDKG